MTGADFNWFKKQRLQWIEEISGIYGFINREHICRKFGVSVPQASLDIADMNRMFPGALEYDRSTKVYRRKNP